MNVETADVMNCSDAGETVEAAVNCRDCCEL